ncbi:MAG: polysaccharide deacetylase family protein [Gammaproteobacteria bacterium]|nr:polysaccharide deacetylase family protein [Gammaproteobacteria bacterium]
MLVAIKVDVDTEIGTRIGVPNLAKLFLELKIPATFYLSLGPDNTGRAIKRIFRRGFLQKVSRTNVAGNYGIRTLLNGVLLPGPHIGKKHFKLLQNLKTQGFEVGIHAYDHVYWQNNVMKLSQEKIDQEFKKATLEFKRIFNLDPVTAASPGWQANAKTLKTYQDAGIIFASDCRGEIPFFPKIADEIFTTLQIPTTLPTLDELLGLPEFPAEKLTTHYLELMTREINVLTIHAELEGMKYLAWFKEFIKTILENKFTCENLGTIAKNFLAHPNTIPVCELIQGEIPGRSGKLAVQNISA